MTDLTDRMRTCAAYIMSRPHDAPMPTEHLLDDAAALLNEASNVLESYQPQLYGEPMEVIPPVVTSPPVVTQTSAMWTGDDLKPMLNAARSKSACPQCDSRAGKTVRRKGKRLFLVCPVCEYTWAR